MANKTANQLNTISGVNNSDLILVYDNDEGSVEKLKSITYSDFKNDLADDEHTHDGRYYTESEADTLLDDKSDTTHNHSGTYEPVFSKNSGFNKNLGTSAGTVSEGDHTHGGSYYTEVELDAGQLDNRYYTESESDTLLGGKSDTSHNHTGTYEPVFSKNTSFNKDFGTTSGTVSEGNHLHDGRYYTESEIDTLLGDKSDTSHNHDSDYYTESETDTLLGGKSDTSHNHSGTYEPVFSKNTGFNKNLGTSAGTVSEGDHLHDSRYYTESETDTLLGDKSDTSHDHDDVYYTETELDGGQLDGRYYTESETDTLISNHHASDSTDHDDRYYTETELNNGQLDNRYYTESETDTLLNGKSGTSHNHDSRYYTESETDTLFDGKSDTSHNHDSRYYTESEVDTKDVWEVSGDQIQLKSAHSSKSVGVPVNLTIGGNLTVSGTTTTVNSEEVTVADKMITVNDGETGAGLTGGTEAGIEVDRGTETNYKFIFNETQDNFRVGEDGSLQAVATREDSPSNGYVPVWNNTTKMFSTSDGIALSSLSQTSHTHDSRYYTESEVNNLLGGKSDTSHNHNSTYYTETEVNNLLDDKSDTTHNHSGTYEPVFGKNTAFNKNFGTSAGTVSEGNHTHDSRYYTETELNAGQLDNRYYTESETDTLLDGKSGTSHTHAYSAITGTHGNEDHSSTFITTGGVTYEALNGNSDVGTGSTQVSRGDHTHDSRYYTESETNTLLAGKSSTSHNHDSVYLDEDSNLSDLVNVGTAKTNLGLTGTSNTTHYHDSRYYTESETDTLLAGKSSTSHNHDSNYLGITAKATDSDKLDNLNSSQFLRSDANDETTGSLRISGTSKSAGYIYSGSTDPTNTTRLNYDGYLYATRVYNAVWNDVADFQTVIGEVVPGKCYYDTLEGAIMCTERCQKSVIGILSDTYGFGVGIKEDCEPIAVAGWVLAYVVGNCEPGDPLTNNENGDLVVMERYEKLEYPERIVAIYKKPEPNETFGTKDNPIAVNGRHWVKVK